MKKGFTLVELLAVIVILAVIALITIPAVMKMIDKATVNSYRRSIDLYGKTITNAIISYESDMVEKGKKIDVTFGNIDSYIEYEGNDVDCKNRIIYSDRTILLTQCYVEDELVYADEGKGYSDENFYYYTNSRKKIKTIKYIEAVEEAIEDKNINGTCSVEEDKIICNGEEINIRSNLENAIEGTLTIENNKVKNYNNLKFETEKKVIKQEEIPEILDEMVTEDPHPSNNNDDNENNQQDSNNSNNTENNQQNNNNSNTNNENNQQNNNNSNNNNDSNNNNQQNNNDQDSTSTTFNVSVDLSEGLIPVIYDGNNWKVVDKNDPNWYDYDNQKWANAVILRSDVTKTVGQTVTVEGDNPEALIMLVWIPKYEYKIEGQYGKGGTSASSPGEIEINFIKGTTRTATSGYHIHPAFDISKISGIWVGKFELSTQYVMDDITSSKLRVLPKYTSFLGKFVSEYFRAIRGIVSDDNTFNVSNIDIHMIKNSEWGAAAYLSQSKYGKYGNDDFVGDKKEIYINKSASNPGRSGGDIPSRVTYSTDEYTYDGYIIKNNVKTETRNLKKGTGASTTGTIYGIYDMSGGAGEYVMGVYGSETAPFLSESGFSSGEVFSMYYNLYGCYRSYSTNLTLSKACANNMCLGHALSETKGWYGDISRDSTSLDNTWFIRGGTYSHSGDSAGIFAFYNSDGYAEHSTTSRLSGFVLK